MDDARFARFMAKVDRTDPSGCWLWTGSRKSSGYGSFWHPPRVQLAHRVSYEHFIGPIPDGMFVCHSCDVPRCVNPAHLWVGTQKDNIRDALSKNRHYSPSGPGMQNGNARLSESDVLAIRASTDAQKVIAARYGVSQQLVSAIRTRRAWTHI